MIQTSDGGEALTLALEKMPALIVLDVMLPTLDGCELHMTHREFDLLAMLMRNRGAILSRDLLLERVWGYEYKGVTKTVEVHVRWLREKIELDPSNPKRIVTIRGVGYRFENNA